MLEESSTFMRLRFEPVKSHYYINNVLYCCNATDGVCLSGVWYWRSGRQRGAASGGETPRRQYFKYCSSIGQQKAGFLLNYCCTRMSKVGIVTCCALPVQLLR